MAVVAPVLIFLLFGIIEMGLLLKDDLVLGSACREAARTAALGRSVAQITTMARTSASSLVSANIGVQLTYLNPATNTFVPLTDGPGGSNSAPVGAQIKVSLTYPHNLVGGPLTSGFADPGRPYRTLRTTLIVMRG